MAACRFRPLLKQALGFQDEELGFDESIGLSMNTHRLLSSSFLKFCGLYLESHKVIPGKELRRSLWVGLALVFRVTLGSRVYSIVPQVELFSIRMLDM